jgi:hypothetical protein
MVALLQTCRISKQKWLIFSTAKVVRVLEGGGCNYFWIKSTGLKFAVSHSETTEILRGQVLYN